MKANRGRPAQVAAFTQSTTRLRRSTLPQLDAVLPGLDAPTNRATRRAAARLAKKETTP